MSDLLKTLGFVHFVGPLWKHKDIGIIAIKDEDTPEDLIGRIYERGWAECQAMIRASLGINDNK